MTKRKIILIVSLFILVITGLRLIWINHSSVPEFAPAVQGQLDLRHWDARSNHILPLRGEWEFYPNAFIMDPSAEANVPDGYKNFIQVPGSWDSSFLSHHDSGFG